MRPGVPRLHPKRQCPSDLLTGIFAMPGKLALHLQTCIALEINAFDLNTQLVYQAGHNAQPLD